ncbi:hypothetical protein CLV62_1273 [Dysgonomonas alginatilytica]|uniref:Uncharacterized protein n=1 Tax=Dysgonomonas alginatilytica TaxID=1605892 RepID=A0A2V3PJT2_9BACT|nr:hypothetical protein [Dysgonomonas alginatilytica]PXV61004.1 hypothetical protein CLV62_1273 [Dysgonomonas alginatilytica]
MKNILFIIVLLHFFGCKQANQPEQKIIFLNLGYNLLPDTLGDPQLNIYQYVEYNSDRDPLIIAKSSGNLFFVVYHPL